MCGIIGIVSDYQQVSERILQSIKRLEYRGYDSTGMATINNNAFELLKVAGKAKELEASYQKKPITGKIGIGHTRWATHGAPHYDNAHPLIADKVCVVHNGIIENYAALKQYLIEKGATFIGQTDTEVLTNLIAHYYQKTNNHLQAVQQAAQQCHGLYAFVAMFADAPELLFGVKNGLPLAIGFGENEMYLGSDAFALFPLTNKLIYLADGEIAIISAKDTKIMKLDGTSVTKEAKYISIQDAEGKQNFEHYMLKEIYDQPRTLATAFDKYFDLKTKMLNLDNLNIEWEAIKKIHFIACGTSYYAGMCAKYWFEKVCGIEVEVDIASEFRYRSPILHANSLYIFISQSGETADTIAAMKYVHERALKTLAIVNVMESSIANLAENKLSIHSGVEIGVASTKAFTGQLMITALLMLHVAHVTGKISDLELEKHLLNLHEVSGKISEALTLDKKIQKLATEFTKAKGIICMGRGVSYPVALEGALKIKELSYIFSEAFPAGELKHGPIALVDETIPIIVIAPTDEVFEKVSSNVQEVHARGGKIILISDEEGCQKLQHLCYQTVTIPVCNSIISPIISAIPMQLFAYYLALANGCDVDQPRNLAKSVTVE